MAERMQKLVRQFFLCSMLGKNAATIPSSGKYAQT
jgi:hypothetical protein